MIKKDIFKLYIIYIYIDNKLIMIIHSFDKMIFD